MSILQAQIMRHIFVDRDIDCNFATAFRSVTGSAEEQPARNRSVNVPRLCCWYST